MLSLCHGARPALAPIAGVLLLTSTTIAAPPGQFKYDPTQYMEVCGTVQASAGVAFKVTAHGGSAGDAASTTGDLADLPEWIAPGAAGDPFGPGHGDFCPGVVRLFGDCNAPALDVLSSRTRLVAAGPNYGSDTSGISAGCDGALECGRGIDKGEAAGLFSNSYTVSALSKVLSVSVASGMNGTASAHSDCSGVGASFGCSYPSGLGISFPFIVTAPGTLLVQASSLSLLGFGSQTNCSSVSGSASGSWSISSGGLTIASDSYSVDTDNPLDQWTGNRHIPLPAGVYQFSASYAAAGSVGAGANWPEVPDCADIMLITTNFNVKLVYLATTSSGGTLP